MCSLMNLIFYLREFSPSQCYKYKYSICFVLILIFSGPGKNHSLSSETTQRWEGINMLYIFAIVQNCSHCWHNHYSWCRSGDIESLFSLISSHREQLAGLSGAGGDTFTLGRFVTRLFDGRDIMWPRQFVTGTICA